MTKDNKMIKLIKYAEKKGCECEYLPKKDYPLTKSMISFKYKNFYPLNLKVKNINFVEFFYIKLSILIYIKTKKKLSKLEKQEKEVMEYLNKIKGVKNQMENNIIDD